MEIPTRFSSIESPEIAALYWAGEYVGREHFIAFSTISQQRYDVNITARLFNGIVSVALGRNIPSTDMRELDHDFTVLRRSQIGLKSYKSLSDKDAYRRLSPASQIYAEYAVAVASLTALAHINVGPSSPGPHKFLTGLGSFLLDHKESADG